MKQNETNLSFKQLILREALINNLASLNYDQMTPVQEKTLPHILLQKDVIAQAKTGSGKTAAFGLGILNHLKVDIYHVQALVLCPTRELAEQVAQSLRRYARLMPNVKVLNLSGGLPMKPQLDSLRHGAHIIVGTPGRVLKHLENKSLSLKRLQTLVLDEADRMLDMGFYDDMQTIVSESPKQRQTLLFSATYSDDIKNLAKHFQHNPEEVFIETPHEQHVIEQKFYEVPKQADKFSLLQSLLLHYQPVSTLIFCNTKQLTTELTASLVKAGFSAAALNGDMEQVDRDRAVVRFINKSCAILVATDVAARGLDIKELPAVINYELSFEHDVHVHRIGRTGRAGNSGLAISLTTPADAVRICAIEDKLSYPITWCEASELVKGDNKPLLPEMITLCLSGGKKDKIRPGDILGALTKDAGLSAEVIGKIDIMPTHSYVAVARKFADKAFHYFQDGKLKARKLQVRKL